MRMATCTADTSVAATTKFAPFNYCCINLSIRSILGDIRLWVGDSATLVSADTSVAALTKTTPFNHCCVNHKATSDTSVTATTNITPFNYFCAHHEDI
jgi:hypothetical protein